MLNPNPGLVPPDFEQEQELLDSIVNAPKEDDVLTVAEDLVAKSGGSPDVVLAVIPKSPPSPLLVDDDSLLPPTRDSADVKRTDGLVVDVFQSTPPFLSPSHKSFSHSNKPLSPLTDKQYVTTASSALYILPIETAKVFRVFS
jgi:hypothetical protein